MAGKIFINYRRGDDPGNSGRLFDRLQDAFSADQLFLDVDNIAPGLDFVRELSDRVEESDILLAVIGKGWLDARDAAGNRRLDDPHDFVRIEISSALNQGKRVIPVLVGEAQMPRPDDLPDELRPLARRNAVRLTHERFRADMQGLIKALQKALEDIAAQQKRSAPILPINLQPKPSEANPAGVLPRLEARQGLHRPGSFIAIGIVLALVFFGGVGFWFKTYRPSQALEPAPAPVVSARAVPAPVTAAPAPIPHPPAGEAASPIPAPVEPAKSASGQQAQLNYSPWTKFCLGGPAATRVCLTAKDAHIQSGAAAVTAAIVEPQAGQAVLRVVFPLGVELVHGTRVIIDQNQPITAPYLACSATGCVADYALSADLIGKLKTGQGLVTQAINASGQPVSLPLPLTDFVKAYGGPPIDANNVNAAEQATLQPTAPPLAKLTQDELSKLIYSPWSKFCLKSDNSDPSSKQVCFTGKDARIQSGLAAVAAVLIEPQDGTKKILRITLPLGMQLIHGTRVTLDQNQPMSAPYVICFANGCMADYEATADVIAQLNKAQELTVQGIGWSSQSVSVVLPLADFAKAYDDPPMDPKVFEAQQQKLQEELQARNKPQP